MMNRLFLLTTALLLVASLNAQSTLKATKLNIFKNGSSFIVREGKVKINEHQGRLTLPNAPLLGTYWITPDKNLNLNYVDFRNDTIKKDKFFLGYAELFKLNKGKEVELTLELTNELNKTVKGTIKNVIPHQQLLILEQGDNSISIIQLSKVVDINFSKTPMLKTKRDSIARLGILNTKQGSGNFNIMVSYMHRGIQWMPQYNIKLLDDNELYLEMEALVENSAEDLNDIDLTLTIGDPKFRYGSQVDPLAVQHLQSLASTTRAQPVRYAYQNTRTVQVEEATVAGNANYDHYQPYQAQGEKSYDLFEYSLGKTSLKKNTKTRLDIFADKFDYEHIYKLNITDNVNYQSTRNVNSNNNKLQAQHYLKIKNSSKYPLTTGSVFVQDEKLRPLAQEQINYTAIGGNAWVALAPAIDITTKTEETEKNKQINARKFSNYFYDKVTIDGVITITNYLDKKVKMEVNKTINGTLISTNKSGEVTQTGSYNNLNGVSYADWEITIGKGETIELKYTYEVYVRHY